MSFAKQVKKDVKDIYNKRESDAAKKFYAWNPDTARQHNKVMKANKRKNNMNASIGKVGAKVLTNRLSKMATSARKFDEKKNQELIKKIDTLKKRVDVNMVKLKTYESKEKLTNAEKMTMKAIIKDINDANQEAKRLESELVKFIEHEQPKEKDVKFTGQEKRVIKSAKNKTMQQLLESVDYDINELHTAIMESEDFDSDMKGELINYITESAFDMMICVYEKENEDSLITESSDLTLKNNIVLALSSLKHLSHRVIILYNAVIKADNTSTLGRELIVLRDQINDKIALYERLNRTTNMTDSERQEAQMANTYVATFRRRVEVLSNKVTAKNIVTFVNTDTDDSRCEFFNNMRFKLGHTIKESVDENFLSMIMAYEFVTGDVVDTREFSESYIDEISHTLDVDILTESEFSGSSNFDEIDVAKESVDMTMQLMRIQNGLCFIESDLSQYNNTISNLLLERVQDIKSDIPEIMSFEYGDNIKDTVLELNTLYEKLSNDYNVLQNTLCVERVESPDKNIESLLGFNSRHETVQALFEGKYEELTDKLYQLATENTITVDERIELTNELQNISLCNEYAARSIDEDDLDDIPYMTESELYDKVVQTLYHDVSDGSITESFRDIMMENCRKFYLI